MVALRHAFDQLRNPTLGNRVWAAFTLFGYIFAGDADIQDFVYKKIQIGPLLSELLKGK